MAEDESAEAELSVTFDLHSILASSGRDFLVRSNGDLVSIDTLKGRKVGLYFSASWCGPCRRFTPTLIEAYNELTARGKDFQIIFVSSDEDEESFDKYFSKMPWLAIPFSDSDARDKLEEMFGVKGVPQFVVLDENGKVLIDDGVEIVRDYEADAYPFTPERINELKEQEATARKEQTLKSILVSPSRDFVLSADGKKVPVAQLEGKTVGLYFSLTSYRSCIDFTPVLMEVYEKLKAKRENFEIVLIPLDEDEESFKQGFRNMPWYSLPFKDKSCIKLARYFDLSDLPTLVVVGPDGKTLHPNAADAVDYHGVEAFPFTPERFEELAQIEKARQDAQTLESLLVSDDRDYLIDKSGSKVPVSQLVGKYVLLYFSANWCPPCRAFLPRLIEFYHEVKAKGDDFEVVFISSDNDQTSFEEFFEGMPWLALPFGDLRKAHLARLFKVFGIPKLVVIGPSGKTISTEARELIMLHGAKAYPFTEERLKEIEAELEEMAKDWPKKMAHALHEEHELVLTRRAIYTCDGCEEDGRVWCFNCEECDFDLHPNCALEEKKGPENDEDLEGKSPSEEWICDGNVCFRA